MLIRFSVENFLSFYTREIFSMLPGKGTLKKEHKLKPVKGVSTLKTSLILGANASGKSNLIKAIAFGKKIVLKGVSADQLIEYSKFRLNANADNSNSRLEYEIQTNGKNYAFGFVFNKHQIVEEWLYEISKGKTDKLIYERNTTNNTFDIQPLLLKNTKEEHKQFLNFIAKGTPDNQLFLREVITRKVKENVKDISDISAVYNWFLNSLKVIFPDDKYKDGIKSELVDNEVLKNIFEELLKYFGTGISGICLQDIELNKLNIPNEAIERIREDLLNKKTENVRAILSTPNYTYFISKSENDIRAQKFMTEHTVKDKSEPEYFDTKDESDGTNRIIDFIPLIIDLLKGDNVFIIDEMERSLHPNLIYDIFDLFLEFSNNINSQLIVSTHESSLLTQKLFRKDEIWFAVKDDLGESHLHSLEDYNVRFDKEIRKDYLQGRYKAVPRIGNRYKLTNLKPE